MRKRMATKALMLIAAYVLMGYCSCITESGATLVPDHDGKVINLGGKVMCQDCTKGYGEWVRGHQPIKGCKVSVTCMDERRKIMYYGSDETDEQGRFNMAVDKYINGKELQPKLCLVRLVSSPHPTCNIPTDFARGYSGVKLPARATVCYRDLVQYELGNFFYTTPRCDEPKPATPHDHPNNNSNNY